MARGQDIRAGGAFVEIYLKGIEAAGQKVQQFGTRLAAVGAGITAAGAAIVTPFIAAAHAFADAGGALDDMSQRAAVSAEWLSEMGYVAKLSGTNIDALGGALFRMRRRIANAATGGGPAIRALKDLGINAKELTQLPVEDQFDRVAKALGEVSNESLRAQYAFEILGDGAKALIPMLGSNIAALRQEARELGIVLSEEDVAAAAALGDSMDRLGAIQEGIWNQIGAAVAGPLTQFYNMLATIGGEVSKWVHRNRELFRTIFLVGVAIMGAGVALTALGTTIVMVGLVMSQAMVIWGFVTSVIAAITSPIGLVIVALVALGAAFFTLTETGKGVAQALTGFFGRIVGSAVNSVKAVTDAFAAGDISAAIEILSLEGQAIWEELVGALVDRWKSFESLIVSSLDFLRSGLAGHIAEQMILWQALFESLPEMALSAFANLQGQYGGFFSFILKDLHGFMEAVEEIQGIDTSGARNLLTGLRVGNDAVTAIAPAMAEKNLGQVEDRLKRAQQNAAQASASIRQEAEGRAQVREEANIRRREEREKKIAELRGKLGSTIAGIGSRTPEDWGKDPFGGMGTGAGVFATFSARELLGFSAQTGQTDAKRTADGVETVAQNTREIRDEIRDNLRFA